MAIDRRDRHWIEALLPGSRLARAGLALLAIVLAALALFFILAVTIVLSVVATGALVRWWWMSRKLASARGNGAIEGEFIRVGRTNPPRLEEPRER